MNQTESVATLPFTAKFQRELFRGFFQSNNHELASECGAVKKEKSHHPTRHIFNEGVSKLPGGLQFYNFRVRDQLC